MTALPYNQLLNAVLTGQSLTQDQTRQAFDEIMDGAWSEAQIAGLLVALRAKGETVDEIAGAAEAMRRHVIPVCADDPDVVDTCGTGGTGLSTFNISTAAAMVLAGGGVRVAKHGNRTHTRASGSANVLEALGVNLDADPERVRACIDAAGVGFCFAVKHHPAMRFAGPVRKALAVRTVFNLLGPLTNPAGARRQVMGIYDGKLTETVATVLGKLGAVHAMVLHADDGLDEISLAAPTRVSEFRDGTVRTYRVDPDQLGLTGAPLESLMIDSPEASAETIRAVLSGRDGPHRQIVLANAAAGFVVAGKADTLGDGVRRAAESIDSGAAGEALETLVRVSRG